MNAKVEKYIDHTAYKKITEKQKDIFIERDKDGKRIRVVKLVPKDAPKIVNDLIFKK